MAKYKAYPEYKDSGVEWLGPIPKSWTVCRLKNLATIKNGQDYKSVQTEDGYPVMGSGGQFTFASKFMYDKPSVLLGRKGTIDKPLYINEPFWTVDTMYYTELNEGFDAKYLHYLALTIQFSRYSTNTALPSMTQEHLSNYKFSVPKAESERKKITEFLDLETAKIDNLIEKQQQLIELLKEKRQAVISHAVTKGLNPNVPMKDSGVEWLGEVPEHWGITKLKWVGRTTSGGTPTTSKFEIYYEDGHIPWIRTTDLNNGELFDTPIRITSKAVNDTACSILPVGSVLLGMYGGAGSIGKHAILRFESTINQAVCGVLPCGRILPDFLHKYYEFYRPFWMIDAAGTRKDPNIGQDNIKEGIILIPPFEEQVEINNHIDNMRNIYECIIENALEGMDLLQERRTALISAAVTGKIDVRDWVAPETQDVEEPQEVTA